MAFSIVGETNTLRTPIQKWSRKVDQLRSLPTEKVKIFVANLWQSCSFHRLPPWISAGLTAQIRLPPPPHPFFLPSLCTCIFDLLHRISLNTLTTLHITIGAFPLVQDLWWVARNNGVMYLQVRFFFGSSSAPDKSGERFCNFFTALILKTPHITAELKHN